MQRILPLQGGRNFRDLGGYPAHHGRRTRWATVFRSGVLCYLTPADRAYLDGLRVRTLCDLRTADERLREPTDWGGPDLARIAWDYDRKGLGLRSLLGGPSFTAEQGTAAMLEMYRRIPESFAERYAAVFSHLVAGELPLVFNCSAGKDRTGVMAALILSALGVSRDDVLADYTLTDSAFDLEKAMFEHPDASIGLGDEYAFLARASREARLSLITSRAEYLQAAFAHLEWTYGSVESYLRARLGLSEVMRERLCARLLD